jgi:hypothetical protein
MFCVKIPMMKDMGTHGHVLYIFSKLISLGDLVAMKIIFPLMVAIPIPCPICPLGESGRMLLSRILLHLLWLHHMLRMLHLLLMMFQLFRPHPEPTSAPPQCT